MHLAAMLTRETQCLVSPTKKRNNLPLGERSDNWKYLCSHRLTHTVSHYFFDFRAMMECKLNSDPQR